MSTTANTKKYRKGAEREKQLDLIIEKGRAMFSTEPELSMSKLANRVNLGSASSLYRYVNNKRELWFAIIINDFCNFSDELDVIVNNPQNVSYKAILLDMCRYFLKFSREEFPKFKVMFLMEPPRSEGISKGDRGPFEISHEARGFTTYLNIVQKAQNAGEIRIDHPAFLVTGTIWSLLLGASTSVSPLYSYLGEEFFSENLPKTDEDPRIFIHDQVINHIEEYITNQ
ncbi:MAG: hypothetical protein ACW99A_11550 [Candidatus Kariarchaeaceae archaeon]|jgi:hypothetical protein